MTASEPNQNSRIAMLLQDILEACQNHPLRIEVALSNLKQLQESIKKYDKAPNYYNSFFENQDEQNLYGSSRTSKMYKYPIIGELEKSFGRHIKKVELLEIAKKVSLKTGIRLNRDFTLSKARLLDWFSQNWSNVQQESLIACSEFLNQQNK